MLAHAFIHAHSHTNIHITHIHTPQAYIYAHRFCVSIAEGLVHWVLVEAQLSSFSKCKILTNHGLYLGEIPLLTLDFHDPEDSFK